MAFQFCQVRKSFSRDQFHGSACDLRTAVQIRNPHLKSCPKTSLTMAGSESQNINEGVTGNSYE